MTLTQAYRFGDQENIALSLLPCQAPRLNHQVRHDFLRALHPTGYRDVRAFFADRREHNAKTDSFHVDNLPSVDAFANTHHARDLYVGVASRVGAKGRGIDACLALHALFVDLDFKDSSETQTRARLAAFGVQPSIVVASGGGLQCYWLLTSPLDLQNGDAAYVTRLLRALATALGADLRAAEAARVLRLPGTRNHKYDPPRSVVVEALYAERRYPLDAILAVLPPLAAKEEPTRETTPAAHDLTRDARIRFASAWLAGQAGGYAQGYRPSDPEQNGNTETYKVACTVAVGYDLDEDGAFEAMRDWMSLTTWKRRNLDFSRPVLPFRSSDHEKMMAVGACAKPRPRGCARSCGRVCASMGPSASTASVVWASAGGRVR